MKFEEEDTSEAKVIIKTEDTEEEKADVAQADSGPPTLEQMLADPIAFRRYVMETLAKATPEAPLGIRGHDDACKKWRYRHLLTATLKHLLAVFKNHAEPRQATWRFYQSWLIVNNTDYNDSPFISFPSARNLFNYETGGRRMCARVARGLPERGKKEE